MSKQQACKKQQTRKEEAKAKLDTLFLKEF
jgi:hypothetical protein